MKTTQAALCAGMLLFGVAGAAAQSGGLAAGNKVDPAMKVATADFAKAAAASDQFEIRSSELAKEKAKSAEVKDFATQMIADHEKSTKGLKTALGDKMQPSATLSPKQTAMLKQLEAAKAADFETLYVDMQTHSHAEAVMLFRTYAGNGDDAKVKAFAKETLPVVEMHADHVQKIVARM